jgi:hypothetical protein
MSVGFLWDRHPNGGLVGVLWGSQPASTAQSAARPRRDGSGSPAAVRGWRCGSIPPGDMVLAAAEHARLREPGRHPCGWAAACLADPEQMMEAEQ